MPDHRKPAVLDGLTVVRMVRHASDGPEKPPAGAAPVKPEPDQPEKKKAFKGHTVVPEKHPIRCYECGYEFYLTVRVQTTYCPKCRKTLALTDHTIEGISSASIKTAGTIHILPQAAVRDGELVANDIILEGRLAGGRLEAYRRLELRPGAETDFQRIKAPSLKIAAGMNLRLEGSVFFRDVELLGQLEACLALSGVMTIRPGGLFIGELSGSHLVVEEGGGLQASLQISSPD